MTLAVRSEALPTLEKARALLERSRKVQDVMKIKALAQAVASCEASESARIEACAIVLLAKARIGELTAAIEKAPAIGKRAGRGRIVSSAREQTKSAQLEAEGISRKEAAECERIAELKKSGDLDRVIAKRPDALTTAGAVALSKLPASDRKRAIAKLGDVPDVRRAVREVTAAIKTRELAKIARGNAPIGSIAERFPIVLADPPWKYEHSETVSREIENHYPTMALEEICALDVGKKLATDDAVLFLWVPSPKLAEAMRVIEAWGFEYRTGAVWDKEIIGPGYYWRQQHEHILLATRGNPPKPPPAARPSSILKARRTKHSKKPPILHEQIERMYPELPKLELFARAPREGWAVWGNQSEGK